MGFPDGMYSVAETTAEKEEFFHWMAYSKFQNIEEIDKGAFSTVFRTKYLNQSGSYEDVAIKIVKDSNRDKDPFLKELKA
ncbi:putative Non-specific protein-tyrosine kinase [Gigaspora margarita]|uniref:Putative Non-specific protein-tyrosine kinase n=1 Tax=Gigaspora margarita TaxID=4874 RepID=A0A8H3X6M9_GIGMA|nr:putative Non-specific protein-tyrosine kinase [Gigaspora margarita]